jgi:hypothetical protein
MTIYTDVFGGANIYPSEISYSSVALVSDIVLSWPEETSASQNLATRIMDVTASSINWSITLPAANKTGTGNTIMFNNRGVNLFTVRDATGVQVVTVAPGTVWQIYLTDNTTEAGVWRSLQFGATTSQVNASSLAGTGIVAAGALLSQSVPITTFNNNYTSTVADRAKMFNWTGAGGTFTLPDPTVLGNNWFIYLRNSGSGAVSADPPGLTSIDGLASLSFQPTESAIIASDGSNFYTIGFGQSATFAFDYTVIDVSGTGVYTLAGSELNRVSYRFTGTLTGNRIVVVPATVQQYWVDNQTTGAYTLTIEPSGPGTGFIVGQGQRVILYCDGTDVLNASTQGISVPLTIAEGGTGATTASGARLNLGGTSVGVALFTAFDQAAAWTALGVAQAGNVDGGTF